MHLTLGTPGRRAALALLLATPAALAQTPQQDAAEAGRFVAALSALHAGDADAAAETLESLLETRPSDPAVLDALAETYGALGRPDDARYHAELAAAATDRPAPRLRLAALQAEAGDLEAAAASYAAATATPTADPAPLVALAELYARLGRPAEERRTLETLLSYGETTAARLRLAALAEAAGEPAEAARHLAVAAALDPGEPSVWRRLAEARAAAGDAAGAADAQARADRLDPAAALAAPPADDGDLDALGADALLARLTTALNRADGTPPDAGALAEALALSDRLLDVAPRRPDVLAATGEAAALAGDDAAAADRLVDAVRADPRQLGAWELSLTVLARSGDARAGEHADEATLLFGSVPRIVGAAALAYAAAGRDADARDAALRALDRLDPNDPLRPQLAPLAQ